MGWPPEIEPLSKLEMRKRRIFRTPSAMRPSGENGWRKRHFFIPRTYPTSGSSFRQAGASSNLVAASAMCWRLCCRALKSDWISARG